MSAPTANLAAIAAELRAALNVLPGIDHKSEDEPLREQRRRFHAAVQRLADHLAATHGATITDHWNGARVRMAGITSTSTSGLSGALHNWLVAAEKRIAKGAGE